MSMFNNMIKNLMTHEPIDVIHYTNNISSSVRYINYQSYDNKEEIPTSNF